MRLLLSALAASMALVWLVPDDAAAQSRGTRAKAKKGKVVARLEPRSSAVGSNGLCQRDNGIPNDKINFRNRCEVEEFWARIIERPTSGER